MLGLRSECTGRVESTTQPECQPPPCQFRRQLFTGEVLLPAAARR